MLRGSGGSMVVGVIDFGIDFYLEPISRSTTTVSFSTAAAARPSSFDLGLG